MQRFVSKCSSSSVDLASSSATSTLDDVRVAMALSVGLSWPEVKRQRSAGRSSWQQLWERATGAHHTPPCAPAWSPVAAAGLVATRRDHPDPLTHEEIAHTSTPCAAPTAPATPAAAPAEDRPSGRMAKRRKIHTDPIARDWIDRINQNTPVPRETERATSSTAWQENS